LVDTTTLIVISTIAQTVVITITLLVFILQFRSQEKSIREASYQGLLGRYNDFIRGMVETPFLARSLFDESEAPGVSDDEAMTYAHLLVAYGIIEEAYLLYVRKWISEDDWMQWSAWLAIMAQRFPMRRIRERTEGTFDRRFEEYVTKLFKDLDKQQSTPKKPGSANSVPNDKDSSSLR
jgi:hypothetical protein